MQTTNQPRSGKDYVGRCHGWYVNRKLGGRHRLAITRDDAGFFRLGCAFYLQRFPNQ